VCTISASFKVVTRKTFSKVPARVGGNEIVRELVTWVCGEMLSAHKEYSWW